MIGPDEATGAPRYHGPRTPATDRLARVASALDAELRRRVVFIGASVMQFVATDHLVFESSRPTNDVDGVVATTGYAEKGRIEEKLRDLKFRHDMNPGAHADRWRLPDGTIFDLVSCGAHLGGTGSKNDEFAIATAESVDLPPLIRHASGLALVLLKCSAFHDRGKQAPLESKDLMDLAVLLATRPELPAEFATAPAEVQAAIRSTVRYILETPVTRSAISTHVRDRGPVADDVEDIVVAALRALTA